MDNLKYMKKTNQLTATFLVPIFFAHSLLGAEIAPNTLEKQVRNTQYRLESQESELGYLKERIASFETVLETTHQEVTRLVSQAKDAIKNSSKTVDTKVDVVEKNIEKIAQDLKTFKKQANELATNISTIQKNLKEKEEIASLQAQQIKDLEQAMRLLTSALQTKTASSSNGKAYQKSYEVKPGDTLDKIAKELDTTVAKIKAENALQKDIIYPGQKLQVP